MVLKSFSITQRRRKKNLSKQNFKKKNREQELLTKMKERKGKL
jgi:hypothetical protein